MSCSSPSEDIVTPAFGIVRRRTVLGVRLEGRTGNLPSSGLSPDQFTAISEAALYVLNNVRKHIRGSRGLDPCSSARWFDGWKKAPNRVVDAPPVAPARTWLARVGWRRRGLIDVDECPRFRPLE